MELTRYFWLSPKDPRDLFWVFYRYCPGQIPALQVRPRYESLKCPACGKIDKLKAIELGFDRDLEIKSTWDLVATNDGMKCFGTRAKELVKKKGIRGLRFVRLPDKRYWIALGDRVAAVEKARGLRSDKPCRRCGEPRWAGGFPKSKDMELPQDSMRVVSPDLPSTDPVTGRVIWLLLPEPVTKIFGQAKLTGVRRYLEAQP